jgi:hypothetical protein
MNLNTRLRVGTVATLFVLAGTTVALAQRPDPEQMIERRMTAMKERLKLTDDQATKLKPVLLDNMKQQMALREKFNVQQGQPPSEEAAAAMKKLNEDTNEKVGAILTKDQAEEYGKMMAEQRQRGGGGGNRKKKQQ